MILALLTLLVALTISAVAAYYSIIGLIAIFSAAVIPIAVMGVVLEAGKLITASWLYQNWKTVPKLLKGYIEQTTIASDNSLDIQLIESKIERKYTEIERAEKQLNLLDNALERYTELGAITKGLTARKDQEPERNELFQTISAASSDIATLSDERTILLREQVTIEAEVGPIRYIAELIYGESTKKVLEDAVRAVIILLVLVFDPLAVLLLIAANMSFRDMKRRRKRRERKPKSKIQTRKHFQIN